MNFMFETDSLSNAIEKAMDKYRDAFIINLSDHQSNVSHFTKKEETAMKVIYNGMTGELVKLEAIYLSHNKDLSSAYNLSIYDREKKCEHSFFNVNLADVKFSGGEVSFNG